MVENKWETFFLSSVTILGGKSLRKGVKFKLENNESFTSFIAIVSR